MSIESTLGASRQDEARMLSVDIVRAMAIVFVVLGHALIYAKCGDFLMGCIYSFHMALLFVLSGFVTAASWERSSASSRRPTLRKMLRKIGRSAKRLLIPYVLCGAAIMPIVNCMQTGRFAESFVAGWRNAFLINRFLWYLPCCFFLVCMFTAVTAFAGSARGKRWLVGAAAAFAVVAAAHVFLPGIDYIRSVTNYFVAFFAGAWLWTRREGVLNPDRRLLVCSSVAFALLALLYASLAEMPLLLKGLIKPLAGITALFPLMALANRMKGLLATGAAHVGQTTLFLYCFDFCATPITIWHFRPAGVLPSLAIAFFIVAVGMFVNLAWEYAVLPELKRAAH